MGAVGLPEVAVSFIRQPFGDIFALYEFVCQHWIKVLRTHISRTFKALHASKSLGISMLVGNTAVHKIKHPFLDILGGNIANISIG